MQNTARARIDLTALSHNLEVVRTLCPRSRIMAMLKADAYGHGALPAARALTAADGFAVARLQEAMLLREAAIAHRLLLLGTLLDQADLALCSQQNIDVTAHDENSVAAIAACVDLPRPRQEERFPFTRATHWRQGHHVRHSRFIDISLGGAALR